MIIQKSSINFKTNGRTDILDITPQIKNKLEESGVKDGIVVLFVPGSTAGITTIEFESGVLKDLADTFERLAPESIHYYHDAKWGDGNGYAHIRAALLGPSITVPFNSGRLLLGTWQQIVLIDFDNRPRNRDVVVQIIGE